MTETNHSEEQAVPEKKKMSLQEAMKKQLENKKSQLSGSKSNSNVPQSVKKMQSQQTKKVSNSRRKMGV